MNFQELFYFFKIKQEPEVALLLMPGYETYTYLNFFVTNIDRILICI